ncbi:MAG: sugar phosphate isomerase/epimerase [Victivallales bacterium]|nr:sugar phosphate isomerase/epimerase [Victivallales bacterium]
MARFKIGVMVDSFRIPIPEGVRKAREIGAEGLQVYTARGEMAPENLDKGARQAFRALVESNGLAISALCGDLGGCGFMLASENEDKITRSKAIVDLAVELGTTVVTTHIGHVPESNDSPYYQNELLVCRILGEYAEKHGVTFAIETGPETSERLASFLNDVGSAGIGVNLDPRQPDHGAERKPRGRRQQPGSLHRPHPRQGWRTLPGLQSGDGLWRAWRKAR